MKHHELDCVVATETPLWPAAGLSAIATTGGSGIYFAVSPRRHDLKAELDNAMRKMEKDNPFYADDLYKQYLSTVSKPALPEEEKDWIAEHGEIRIGYLKHDSEKIVGIWLCIKLFQHYYAMFTYIDN